jgi:DNA invertase Pin-like site-specific DNA recombinase
LGLDAQRAAVARYIQGKGALLGEFTEVESGKKKDRPELAAALASAKRMDATLIIAKLDRLARNVHFISGLMESAADFVACDLPSANRLTLHIMAAMAEHEAQMISQRTKAALEQCKARGVKLGNPQWKKALAKANASRKYMRTPERIREMIIAHRNEGKSLREICAALNELGLKTASNTPWHPSSVRAELLKAEAVAEEAA